MTLKSLENIFEKVVKSMCESIEIFEGDEIADLNFFYEDDEYLIEGIGSVGGIWYRDGDGYETPQETYLKNGWGYLTELSIFTVDKNGDENEVSLEIENDYRQRLEKKLSACMKTF